MSYKRWNSGIRMCVSSLVINTFYDNVLIVSYKMKKLFILYLRSRISKKHQWPRMIPKQKRDFHTRLLKISGFQLMYPKITEKATNRFSPLTSASLWHLRHVLYTKSKYRAHLDSDLNAHYHNCHQTLKSRSAPIRSLICIL